MDPKIIVAGVVAIVVIVLLIALLPDVIRYIKISSM
jgi:hypothetical protein